MINQPTRSIYKTTISMYMMNGLVANYKRIQSCKYDLSLILLLFNSIYLSTPSISLSNFHYPPISPSSMYPSLSLPLLSLFPLSFYLLPSSLFSPFSPPLSHRLISLFISSSIPLSPSIPISLSLRLSFSLIHPISVHSSLLIFLQPTSLSLSLKLSHSHLHI